MRTNGKAALFVSSVKDVSAKILRTRRTILSASPIRSKETFTSARNLSSGSNLHPEVIAQAKIPGAGRILKAGVFVIVGIILIVFAVGVPSLHLNVRAQREAQQQFDVNPADLPFARLAQPHAIDSQCPNTGARDQNTYHYAQNALKNNFSAKGTPIFLRIDDFSRLQQASQSRIDQGLIKLQGKYPEDRKQLRDLVRVGDHTVGEGTLVTLQAYVFNSRYANVKYNLDSHGQPGRGEAVNCDNPELDWNDIHIALSGSLDKNVDECTTVTAEISPHYRPALWSQFHDGANEGVESVLPGLLKHRVLKQRGRPLLVRLTGPLFYDASHQPCLLRGNKVIERHTPERRSIWEIHPVYRIQVYDVRNRRWQEFDEWARR